MDDLEWIKQGLEQPGKSQRGLAKALSLDPAGVNRLLKGERQIKAREMPIIQRYLATTPTPDSAPATLTISPEPFMSGKRDLPVRGRAKAGEDGHYIEETDWAAHTTFRPHLLEGVPDAYAVEVWDESMHPVLRHGWMLWVHPGKPFRTGDAVVIQLNDGQALVKELVKRTEKEWIFHQYRPEKDVRYARDKVKAVHLVVGNSRGML